MTSDAQARAADAYNRCWELLEAQPDDERDRELMAAAFSSRLFWHEVGGAQELAIADWMVSRAAAATGSPRLSGLYAEAALARMQDDFPHWLRASLHEGRARALSAAGQPCEEAKAAAMSELALEADPEDAAVIAAQLAELD